MTVHHSRIAAACALVIAASLVSFGLAPVAQPSATHAEELTVAQLVERYGSSVASLRAIGQDGGSAMVGTAFLATPFGSDPQTKYFVTARHNIAGAKAVEVVLGGKVFTAEGVVAEDPAADLAVLKVSGLESPLVPLRLQGELPAVGQSIACIGSAVGLSGSVSNGIVASVRDLQPWGKVIQFTAPTSPGSSGSPLFSMSGEVVGVVSFGARRGQNINFAIPSRRLLALEPRKTIMFGDLAPGEESRGNGGSGPAGSVGDPANGDESFKALATSAIAAAILVGVDSAPDSGDAALVMLEIERAMIRRRGSSGRLGLLDSANSFPRKSDGFAEQAIELLAQVGDTESLQLFITGSLSGRAIADIQLYAAALRSLAKIGTTDHATVQSLSASMKQLVAQVPRAVYDSVRGRFSATDPRRFMLLRVMVPTMVAVGDDNAARAGVEEARSYLSRGIESGASDLEPARDVVFRFREAMFVRAMEGSRFADAEAELGRMETVAGPRPSEDFRDKWALWGAVGWHKTLDARRAELAQRALQVGDWGPYGRYRTFCDGLAARGETFSSVSDVVEVLLQAGDREAAIGVAQRDPAGLLPLAIHFAKARDFKAAAQYMRFLPRHEMPIAQITVAECAWAAGEQDLYRDMMAKVEQSLEDVARNRHRIFRTPMKTFEIAVRWGELLAQSTEDGSAEVGARLTCAGSELIEAAATVGLMRAMHPFAPEPSTTASSAGASATEAPWCEVVQAAVDPTVVQQVALREAITRLGHPWRVRHRSSGIEMVLIPPGSFTLPSVDSAESAANDAIRRVTITKPFYLSVTEVTQEQWSVTMKSNPSVFRGRDDSPQRPVEQVSWYAAQEFAKKTSLRLPTEAEWSHASLLGWSEGFGASASRVICAAEDSSGQTQPVGRCSPDAIGLHGMLGNVSEWTNDRYSPLTPGECTDPVGPSTGGARVLRGGNWTLPTVRCVPSYRSGESPEAALFTNGFRVARDP